jgi:hypothetical protein
MTYIGFISVFKCLACVCPDHVKENTLRGDLVNPVFQEGNKICDPANVMTERPEKHLQNCSASPEYEWLQDLFRCA